MDKKVIVIEQKVPTCPICSSLMGRRYQNGELFFVCWDDMSHIYKMIDNGQTENEMLVSDSAEVNNEKDNSTCFSNVCAFIRNIIQKLFCNRNKNKFTFAMPKGELPKYFICWGGRYR